jgi:hypothetical protein
MKNYYSDNSRPVKGICKNSLTPSRPNLRIMGIEEVEDVQAKGICNIFRKFPKSRENYAQSGAGSLQYTEQT